MKQKTATGDAAGGEEWDARSKVTLIQCYRDEPSLWNTKVSYRSDADRRVHFNEAWKRIEQRMLNMGYNFDLAQLKKKMKQLRDQFSRENKMFEDHSSKWQFYEEMRFLNQEEPSSPSLATLGFPPLHASSSSPMVTESPSPGQVDSSRSGTQGRCSSLDIEVKQEFCASYEDLSLVSDHEKSVAVVSSTGTVLSKSEVDELLRLVLSKKNVILNEAADEESKNRAWRHVHEILSGITQTALTVDELKEIFHRKQLHISDIVLVHAKADAFTAHGFARYVHSIVNKCLPEGSFTARERELGTFILRKSLLPLETTSSSAKKRRFTGVANGEDDEQSCPGISTVRQEEIEKIMRAEHPKDHSCGCSFKDDCLKSSLLEMIKAQKEYFKIAAEAQKEQLRLFSSLGEVLDRVSAKLLAPDREH